jgi:cytochrome c-type biogenesis protein CcmE
VAVSERPTAVPPAPPSLRPRRRLLGSRRRQVVAAVIIAGTIAFLAAEGLSNATTYFLTTKQAVAQKATLGTKPFRIEGTVEDDVRRVGTDTDFTITDDDISVSVVSTNSPPELFKPGIPVVLQGQWAGSYYSSNLIMVKHTASYTEAHPNRLKSQLPASKSTSAGGSGS